MTENTRCAKISCYRPNNSSLVRIASTNSNHNHEVNKAAYQTLGVEFYLREKQVLADLPATNCKASESFSKVKFTKRSRRVNYDT